LVEVTQSQNWFHAEAPERCWIVAVMRTGIGARKERDGWPVFRHRQRNGIFRQPGH
jgi:hypothetical protein